MRAAIIDDFATCREELRGCFYRYFHHHYAGETPCLQEFESGEEFLACFSPDEYDLIFIDQYMNGISGLETAGKIRERDPRVALVFVTTSRDHAIDSFSVRASGYLVKPYEYEAFEKTLELCDMEKIRNARFICVEQEKILLREILWCDRDQHYIQIHTDRRGDLRFRCSFGELTSLLSPYPQFLTCYKGCIVNLMRAERIDGLDFVMDTGARIPFSQRDRKQIETKYRSYLFHREREEVFL